MLLILIKVLVVHQRPSSLRTIKLAQVVQQVVHSVIRLLGMHRMLVGHFPNHLDRHQVNQ